MDKHSVLQLLLLLALWQAASGIVGRELVLTPRQGLQLSGRNIYYEDEPTRATAAANSERPWERTLKHVTYVTLFSTSAGKNGSASQQAQSAPPQPQFLPPTYNEFMRAPYVRAQRQQDTRFGDIITLAQGRLELSAAGAYRFVEHEPCNENASKNNTEHCVVWQRVRALWQVQKIRHRDAAHQKYRYEMKYSVSPLDGAGMELASTPSLQLGDQRGRQTYIQKADDYPHSFAPTEAERRLDGMRGNGSRSFRNAPTRHHGYTQATPMPQSTFMHGIFQPPPPPPPPHAALNMGEYVSAYGGSGIALLPKPPMAKIELFPHLFGLMHGSGGGGGHHHVAPPITPTTYRPHYALKLPRPEVYAITPATPQHAILVEQQQQLPRKPPAPQVTHHYHHHFYMPGSEEQSAAGHDMATNFIKYDDEALQRHVATPGASASLVHFPSAFDRVPERVVAVTPAAVLPMPLKKPHIYTAGNRLLIYPTGDAGEGDGADDGDQGDEGGHATPTPAQPFLQSEPYNDVPVRYSEPDPLYLRVVTGLGADGPKPLAEYAVPQRQPDSIGAQLPAPAVGQDTRIPYVDEEEGQEQEQESQQQAAKHQQQGVDDDEEDDEQEEEEEVLTGSTTTAQTDKRQIQQHKAIAKTTTTTTTEAATMTSTTTMAAATIAAAARPPAEVSRNNGGSASVKREQFVSTSTTQKPLRKASRYRVRSGGSDGGAKNSSSTEQLAAQKWKPKLRSRKPVKAFTTTTTTTTTKAALPEAAVTMTPRVAAAAALVVTTARNAAERDNEVYEVLTQKSVSKSVSIKVGRNGEEIPVIVDDNERVFGGNDADDDDESGSESASQSAEEQQNFVSQKRIENYGKNV